MLTRCPTADAREGRRHRRLQPGAALEILGLVVAGVVAADRFHQPGDVGHPDVGHHDDREKTAKLNRA